MTESVTTGPLASACAEINKCPRCGQCRAYCPVFGELRDEGSVARARIALAKAMVEGRATADADAKRCLEECTLCLACTANCPSGVAVEEIVLAARAELARQLGVTTVQRALLSLFGEREALLPYLAGAASALQGLAFARLPEDSGLRLRFPLGGWEKRVLPALARRPLLRQLPRLVGEARRGTVSLLRRLLRQLRGRARRPGGGRRVGPQRLRGFAPARAGLLCHAPAGQRAARLGATTDEAQPDGAAGGG